MRLTLITLLMFSVSLKSAPLGVAVAANFRAPMEAIAVEFEKDFGRKVNITVSSSGKLYAQILQGAPYDVFFSADSVKPLRLEKDQRIVPGSRFIYAQGSLVLWSSQPIQAGSVENLVQHLNSDAAAKIAMANPTLAPYGLAAKQSLVSAGIYQGVKGRLVYGENISQVMNFAVAGGVKWAFLAFSQVKHLPQQHYIPIPASMHAPIVQEAVMLKKTAAALAFFDFFNSQKVAQLIERYGYFRPGSFVKPSSVPVEKSVAP